MAKFSVVLLLLLPLAHNDIVVWLAVLGVLGKAGVDITNKLRGLYTRAACMLCTNFFLGGHKKLHKDVDGAALLHGIHEEFHGDDHSGFPSHTQ